MPSYGSRRQVRGWVGVWGGGGGLGQVLGKYAVGRAGMVQPPLLPGHPTRLNTAVTNC